MVILYNLSKLQNFNILCINVDKFDGQIEHLHILFNKFVYCFEWFEKHEKKKCEIKVR